MPKNVFLCRTVLLLTHKTKCKDLLYSVSSPRECKGCKSKFKSKYLITAKRKNMKVFLSSAQSLQCSPCDLVKRQAFGLCDRQQSIKKIEVTK